MIKIRRKRFIFFLSFYLLSLGTDAFAVLHKNLWPAWQCTSPLSKERIQHDEWQEFLSKHVVTNEEGINLVDYAHVSQDSKSLLNRYLKRMTEIDISQYNRAEQLAFWINLYNALIVQTIITHYPVNSIEDINISPGLFSIGPWGTKLIAINKVPLSLDDIHNRIIRPIWNDVRSHYTLNNGTIGAPNLSKEVYQGKAINKQLNAATFQYINSLRGVQVIDNAVVVSKLLDWYSEDFGESDKAKLTHLKQYANPSLKNKLDNINTIEHYIYNWHLNAVIGDNENA